MKSVIKVDDRDPLLTKLTIDCKLITDKEEK